MLTNKQSRASQDKLETQSVVSQQSDRSGTFITRTKIESRPDSPTQMAIRALAIYNKQPVPEKEEEEQPE